MASIFGRRIYLDDVPNPEALASTSIELFKILDDEISELEQRLDQAEGALRPPEP
jgi:hypothetical protein